jgi:hypothetical protein
MDRERDGEFREQDEGNSSLSPMHLSACRFRRQRARGQAILPVRRDARRQMDAPLPDSPEAGLSVIRPFFFLVGLSQKTSQQDAVSALPNA